MALNFPRIQYYVVDAFTESPLTGNPAAICLLEEEKEEKWMQYVADEFHLSATCYLIKVNGSITEACDGHANNDETLVPKFQLRWFAPDAELNICGHGTIASAYILFHSGMVKGSKIEFHVKSGKVLLAERITTANDKDALDYDNEKELNFHIRLAFPLIPLTMCGSSEMELASKFMNCDSQPINVLKMEYEEELIIEYSSGKLVADLQPYIEEIQKWHGRGVVVTGAAPENSQFDFYSRFFCPNLGMNEDPVCGSVHCGLGPYWGKKLGKSYLKAYMASSRGGVLELLIDEEKQLVHIQGKAMLVMEGSLFA